MLTGNAGLAVVFNGEITNHEDLRRLHFRNRQFQSRCDTETVLALGEKFGPRCVALLDAMFAIAVLAGETLRVPYLTCALSDAADRAVTASHAGSSLNKEVLRRMAPDVLPPAVADRVLLRPKIGAPANTPATGIRCRRACA